MSVTFEKIMQNHLHVGALKNESNPKTRKYWLGVDNGITVINPELIASQLDHAKKKIQEAKKAGKEVLVVCEKAMYASEIVALAASAWFHYLNTKLPAWFLTNFNTLITRIESMNEKKKFVLSDSYVKLTKKEQVMIKRELSKVEKIYEGVKWLKNKPDLVVVIDGSLTSGLVDELEITKIENIVLASTDFSRWWNEEDLLMMNMQSYKSLDYALHYIFE